MNNATYLLTLLRILEERIPPPRFPGAVAHSHHAITRCQYGNPETGFIEKLGLHIALDEKRVQTVFLDDDGSDFENPVEKLAESIVELLREQGLLQDAV